MAKKFVVLPLSLSLSVCLCMVTVNFHNSMQTQLGFCQRHIASQCNQVNTNKIVLNNTLLGDCTCIFNVIS
jgi:hypothetical protein